MRTPIALLVLLLGTALGPASATATTLLSLAGSGDLQLTTSGDLYFATTDLALDRISLFADQQIVVGPTTYTPPATATVSFDSTSLSGTTVLDFDDDVFVTDFVFQGSVDFSAANIFVSGDLSAKSGISLGTTAGGWSSGCTTSGGIVLLTTTIGCYDTAPVISLPPQFIPPDGGGVLPSSPVPEPGAALLFGAGVILVGARVRRSR